MERQVKKWQMKQVLRKYFAEVTHWCKVEINLWFGSCKSENTPWSRLTSFPPPSSTLQFSLYEWLVVKPVMTLQQECESVGRTIWILFSPLLHSTSCRVHVWSPLQCHVYPGSWKSRAVLEIEERAHGVWVFYYMELPQRGLHSRDKNSFLAQSICSITDTLPNYSPFVYIETKIRTSKKSLPAAQDANIQHTPWI